MQRILQGRHSERDHEAYRWHDLSEKGDSLSSSPGHSLPSLHQQSLPNGLPPQAAFADILRASLIRQMTYKTTCQTCKQFSTFSSRRSIQPPESAGNVSIHNNNNLRYWMDTRTARTLLSTLKVRGEVEKFDESITSKLWVRICGHSCIGCWWLMSPFLGYHLVKIKTVTHSHLVAIVKGESRWLFPSPFASNVILLSKAKNQPHPKDPWFLFSDYVDRNIAEDKVPSSPITWKVCAHFTCLVSYLFTRKPRCPLCCVSNEKACTLNSTIVVALMLMSWIPQYWAAICLYRCK